MFNPAFTSEAKRGVKYARTQIYFNEYMALKQADCVHREIVNIWQKAPTKIRGFADLFFAYFFMTEVDSKGIHK